MAAGEAALAATRPTGRTPVRGGLNEIRTDEHGTRPLPDPSWLPGASTRAAHVPATSPGDEPGT